MNESDAFERMIAMQTAVRKSSRRRVDDARARPHVVLEARRDAHPPCTFITGTVIRKSQLMMVLAGT